MTTHKNDAMACVERYEGAKRRFAAFGKTVAEFFAAHETLSVGKPPIVHSVKSRLKDPKALLHKLQRKTGEGREITVANFFEEVTDLAGVRVFHLHLQQSHAIHEAILAEVANGDWVLHESPKAFSWDPEAIDFFRTTLNVEPELRPTFYTSIHYLLRPSVGSPLCCEVQVRTLFEEVWGEIDHLINYPDTTTSVACREQLRTLAKLVGTGGRLVDSILRSADEHEHHTRRGGGA